MFKKVNWLVVLGALIILAGGVNLWLDYRKAALSPFDVIDAESGGEDFIPIVAPLDESPDSSAPRAYAPTLDSDLARPAALPVEEGGVIQPPLEGSVPERLVIASIALEAPVMPVHYRDIEVGGQVYHQWRVPSEFAAGWQDTSARLGLPGNTVLNGHHNAYGRVFENLAELRTGDVIQVYSGEWEYRYVVAAKLLLPERGQRLEVRMENARWLAASEDERLTLVTCWPAESNTHRLIVIAYPLGRPVHHPPPLNETP
jgi:LPXTG-site transpeptidase (sortase) family protein